jgi:hypothetical protein
MRNLLVLFCVLFFWNNSNAQWSFYCHFPSISMGFSYYGDAEFINPDTGFYEFQGQGGSNSTYSIFYTHNAGAAWHPGFSDSGLGVHAFEFTSLRSRNAFFILTSYSGLANTRITLDGGMSWSMLHGGGTVYSSLSVLDTNYYYLLDGVVPPARISKYANGNFNALISTINNFVPSDLCFIDTSNGYAFGNDTNVFTPHVILKTISGGLNWTVVYDDSTVSIKKNLFSESRYRLECWQCRDNHSHS